MKSVLEILLLLVKSSISFLLSFFLGFWFISVAVCSLFMPNFDLQIIFYLICTAFTIIGLWTIPFRKTKNIIKIGFILLFILQINLPKMLPSVMKAFAYNYCAEDGLCDEGLEVMGKDGKTVTINKENCIKNGWKWVEDGKTCNIWNKKSD
jgi:hypothetical protein